MNKPLASVDMIQPDMRNAKACFGDALQRCKPESPAIALWLDEEGDCKWSASCTNMEALWMLQKAIGRVT